MRDRTADLFAASEALSQLSYSPACLNVTFKVKQFKRLYLITGLIAIKYKLSYSVKNL